MSRFDAAEVSAALERMRRHIEEERRASFNAFGIAPDCLWPAARLFHRDSELGPAWQPTMTLEDVEQLTYDRGYRTYPDAELIALPSPAPPNTSLVSALRGRRSSCAFATEAVPLSIFSILLDLAAGITSDDGLKRRAAPSGGALYPIELYPIALNVADLPARVHHYRPDLHALEGLATVDADSLSPFMPPGLATANPPLVIALTAVFARTQAKYLERGYRFALLECGHVAQNLLLASSALGLAAVPVGGFWDAPFNALLELDTDREAVVYSVLVGMQEDTVISDKPR